MGRVKNRARKNSINFSKFPGEVILFTLRVAASEGIQDIVRLEMAPCKFPARSRFQVSLK